MVNRLADGVSFIAASAGTGTFVFGSSRTSYSTLAQAQAAGRIADGNTLSYLAVDSLSAPLQREWGHGTYSLAGNSIARTTVLGTLNVATSGSGTPLNFAVPPTVFLTALAEDIGTLISLTGPLSLFVCILAGTIVGGTLYTAGTYTNVALTGGSGSGATADITVAGGAVTAVVSRSQGTGYVIGDVLSAAAASIGGTGSGFTYTLTGIGNDSQTGNTIAQAFRTIQRSFLEISHYNLAPGFAVTVSVSDGLYVEQLTFGSLVGSSNHQITYTGNTTTPEHVHVKPNTNSGSTIDNEAVVNFIGCVGLDMKGFWFDGQDPGFGAWHPVVSSAGAINYLSVCRLSVVDNDGWNPYFTRDAGTLIDITNMSYDWFGNQGNFNQCNGGAIMNINASQTLNTPTAAGFPNWVGAWFVEVSDPGSQFIVNMGSGSWINWVGSTGPPFSTQNGGVFVSSSADPQAVPNTGPDPTLSAFAHSNASAGAFFKPGGISDIAHGTPVKQALPTTGLNSDLVYQDMYGFYRVQLTGVQRYWFVLNALGSPLYIPISNISTSFNYQVPTTGFSITLGDTDGRAILNPAGVLATGTITMCVHPFDGQTVEVRTSQTITALTVSPNAGQAIVNPPTTLSAGTKFSAIFRLANTTWYCAV